MYFQYTRSMKRYKIKVIGKVQGVFFRDTARQEAEKLGLTGFARNEPDGSVHIEVEGDEKSLKTFLNWCSQGPDEALVEHLEFTEIAVTGHKDFTIA